MNVEPSKTNHIIIQNVNSIRDPIFRAWTIFLRDHCLLSYALKTPAQLNLDMLEQVFQTLDNSSDDQTRAFSFTLNMDSNDRTFRVTEHDVNRILRMPLGPHVPDPTPEEIHQFFTHIRTQQTDFSVREYMKHLLPRHWNYFFHNLLLVFTAKKTNLSGISVPVQKIGYALAHNQAINYGRVIIQYMLYILGPLETRTPPHQALRECHYPRFLQLILNDLLTDAEKDLFQESGIEQCMKVKTNVVTQLLSKNPFPEVPTVLTPFMQTLPLQLTPLNQPAQGELQGIIPPPPPPNMDNVYIPAPLVAEPEPSVAIPDQEAATQ